MVGMIVVCHPDSKAWVLAQQAAGTISRKCPVVVDRFCSPGTTYIFNPTLVRTLEEEPMTFTRVNDENPDSIQIRAEQTVKMRVVKP